MAGYGGAKRDKRHDEEVEEGEEEDDEEEKQEQVEVVRVVHDEERIGLPRQDEQRGVCGDKKISKLDKARTRSRLYALRVG